ncbi:MAG: YeeE/YedE family protein [Bacteroidetes bacterium]|nr:YeeE/YedE family protein [Bacteroidota bacterium]
MKNIVSLVCGTIFGIGLTLSQMTNPEKVIGFLNVFGDWDPTLVMVMIGALIVTGIGYVVSFKSKKPLLNDQFYLPKSNDIDSTLILGSIFFGFGWGLSGYCPGPAIANLMINSTEAVYFITSMLVGFVIIHIFKAK